MEAGILRGIHPSISAMRLRSQERMVRPGLGRLALRMFVDTSSRHLETMRFPPLVDQHPAAEHSYCSRLLADKSIQGTALPTGMHRPSVSVQSGLNKSLGSTVIP